MKHVIHDSPDFGIVRVTSEAAGEKLIAEAGAMVAMSDGIKMTTSMRGGLLSAAKRKLLGGESMFQNTFTASGPGQDVWIAPAGEGDARALDLAPGQVIYLHSGNYLGHIGDALQLDTKWGGVKSFFGGTGFFMLRVVGPGRVFFSSYGAVHDVKVGAAGYTCDTGHIVGFTDGLDYDVRKFGGYKGLFFSGEGLVCSFRGQGTVWLQTRDVPALASFLEPFRPVEKRSN